MPGKTLLKRACAVGAAERPSAGASPAGQGHLCIHSWQPKSGFCPSLYLVGSSGLVGLQELCPQQRKS